MLRHGKEESKKVACFHMSVKTVSRAAGGSATGSAAYRAGVEITDERTGVVHDYTRKQGVEHTEIVLPNDAPEWATDRSQLWNAAEQSETRKNSTVAREFQVALPAELSADDRKALALELAREISDRHKVAVDVAIHAPGREGDNRNHHAHLLVTTRRLGPDGLGEKTRELDQKQSGEVEHWRERFADLQNRALERAMVAERVDHRSYKRQGLEQKPTEHMGPMVAAIERKAEREAKREGREHKPVTELAQRNENTRADNLRRWIERQLETVAKAREKAERLLEKVGFKLDRKPGPDVEKVAPAPNTGQPMTVAERLAARKAEKWAGLSERLAGGGAEKAASSLGDEVSAAIERSRQERMVREAAEAARAREVVEAARREQGLQIARAQQQRELEKDLKIERQREQKLDRGGPSR